MREGMWEGLGGGGGGGAEKEDCKASRSEGDKMIIHQLKTNKSSRIRNAGTYERS